MGNHVRRRVNAVDVQTGAHPRHQQAASAAGGVEGGLTGLDELTEVVDLRAVEVEVRPPAPGVTQVWVVFHRLDNAYSAAVLEGLLSEAHTRDAVVTVTEWGNAGDHDPRPGSPAWIRQSQDRGAQAFIMVTTPLSSAHVNAAQRRRRR